MNCPARDIVTLLESSPFGLGTFGQTLFVSREPTSPDDCVTVYDTGGFPPDVVANYQRPTVQVRVRNKSYESGWSAINGIRDALHGLHQEVISGTRYIAIWATGEPACIGYDESNRALFTINFRIHRTPHP